MLLSNYLSYKVIGKFPDLPSDGYDKCLSNVLLICRKPAEEPEEPSNSNTDDAGEDASSTADVKDPREYEQVFKPNTKLGK